MRLLAFRLVAVLLVCGLAERAFAPPKGQRGYLQGCGPYVMGFDPGQVNPKLAAPINPGAKEADRALLTYLQTTPVSQLHGEALGTLLLRLQAAAKRNDAVAGSLARFNIPPPTGYAEWTSAAVEAALQTEWGRVRAAAAAEGRDFTKRADLEWLYEALRFRGASFAVIADAFNSIPVNGGGWTPDSIQAKFVDRAKNATEAVLLKFRLIPDPTAQETGRFLHDLLKVTKSYDNTASVVRREGLKPPAPLTEWTPDAVARVEYFGEHGAWPPEGWARVSRAERAADTRTHVQGQIREVLGTEPPAEGPVTLDAGQLGRLIRNLKAHPLPDSAVLAHLGTARVAVPGGGTEWTQAALDAAREGDLEPILALHREQGFENIDTQTRLALALQEARYADGHVVAIFNRIPIGGGKWTEQTLGALRSRKGAVLDGQSGLAALLRKRTFLSDPALEARLHRILEVRGKPLSFPLVAAALQRTGFPPPPGHEAWTPELVEADMAMATAMLFQKYAPTDAHRAQRVHQDEIIADLHALGFPVADIATAFNSNSHRVPTARGAGTWAPPTIRGRLDAMEKVGGPLRGNFDPSTLKNLDPAELAQAYVKAFPEPQPPSDRSPWLVDLYFHLAATNTDQTKIRQAFDGAGVKPPPPASRWPRGFHENLLAEEVKRLQAQWAGVDFARAANLERLYRSLANRGAGPESIATLFELLKVNGASWNGRSVTRRFAAPSPRVTAAFAAIDALPTRDAASLAPHVAELVDVLKQRDVVARELERAGVATLPELGPWNVIAVERLSQLHLTGKMPTVADVQAADTTPYRDQAVAMAKALPGQPGPVQWSDLVPAIRRMRNIPISNEAVAAILREQKIATPDAITWSIAEIEKRLAADADAEIAAGKARAPVDAKELYDHLRARGYSLKDMVVVFNGIPVGGGANWNVEALDVRFGNPKKRAKFMAPVVLTELLLRDQAQQDRILQIHAARATAQLPPYIATELTRRGVPPPPGHAAWTAALVKSESQTAIDRIFTKHKPSNFALRTTIDSIVRELDLLEFTGRDIAAALNAKKIPGPRGGPWSLRAVQTILTAVRSGQPSNSFLMPRYPWRKPPKAWTPDTLLGELKTRTDLSREEVTEAFLELLWHGVPPYRIAELLESNGVTRGFGRTDKWNESSLMDWARKRQEQVLARIAGEKPTAADKVEAAIRELDAVCVEPSAIAEFLGEHKMTQRDGQPWNASAVANFLGKRTGTRASPQQAYFHHPDFDREDRIRVDFDHAMKIVSQKEAEARGATDLWNSMEPMPGEDQKLIARVYNYLKYRASKATDPKEAERDRATALRLRNVLWHSNLRLVLNIMKEYPNLPKRLDIDDWRSEGAQGLLNAIESYDFRRDVLLSTLAPFGIRSALNQQIKYFGAAKRKGGILATDTERADMDTPNAVEGAADTKGAEKPGFEASEQTHALEAVIRRLDGRSAEVLRLRFGLTGEAPMTLKEIGVRLGLTTERIRQIESAALGELREYLGDDFSPE